MEIPRVTTAQMMEVDRLMTDRYQITLTQMMENAGRSLADLALHGFRQGTLRPLLERGLVAGDERYPGTIFGRLADRRASAAVL